MQKLPKEEVKVHCVFLLTPRDKERLMEYVKENKLRSSSSLVAGMVLDLLDKEGF